VVASEALQLGEPRGAAVANVEPGRPAARAGLRPGDIIVAVNRSPVSSVADLRSAMGGQSTILAPELIRDGAIFFWS